MERVELKLKIEDKNLSHRDKENYSKKLEKLEVEITKGNEIRVGKFHHIYTQGRD